MPLPFLAAKGATEGVKFAGKQARRIETGARKHPAFTTAVIGALATGLALTGFFGKAKYDNLVDYVSIGVDTSTTIDDQSRADKKENNITSVKVGDVEFSVDVATSEVVNYPATVRSVPHVGPIKLDIIAGERYIDYSGSFVTEFNAKAESMVGSFNEDTGVATFDIPSTVVDSFGIEVNIVPGSTHADARGNLANSLSTAVIGVAEGVVGQILGDPSRMPGVTSKADGAIANLEELAAVRETGACTGSLLENDPNLSSAIAGKFAKTIEGFMEVGGTDVKEVVLTVDGHHFGSSLPMDKSSIKSNTPAASAGGSPAQTVLEQVPILNDPEKDIATVKKAYADAGVDITFPDMKDNDSASTDEIPRSYKCAIAPEAQEALDALKDS